MGIYEEIQREAIKGLLKSGAIIFAIGLAFGIGMEVGKKPERIIEKTMTYFLVGQECKLKKLG